MDYRESFHVVLIQNRNQAHVWRIEISTPCLQMDAHEHGHEVYSNPESPVPTVNQFDIPTVDVPQENGIPEAQNKTSRRSFLQIKIEKLLQQNLWDGIEIQSFTACTGHFVCGSSYALISASKNCVKLWKLQKDEYDRVEFREWNTLNADVDGTLLQASAAYSGRIACVYKLNRAVENATKIDSLSSPLEKHTCAITIYDCESTGGKDRGHLFASPVSQAA